MYLILKFIDINILSFVPTIVLTGFNWNIFKGAFQFVSLQNVFQT